MAFKCVRGKWIQSKLISMFNIFENNLFQDFAEHLKILGYQEPIPLSMLNTINGNVEVFRVYANILLWLIKCLDPDCILPAETRTENDRVLLIRSATEFLVIICQYYK